MTDNFSKTQNRSSALDLLRFMAVVFVFFGHYTDTFNDTYQIVPANHKYNFISRYATMALMIFFMVSGYVITMTSIKRNLKDFLIIRLSRIYPLFWVSCLLAFILPRVMNAHSYLAYTSFKVFLANLTMIPLAFGQPMINPVFHTLMVELIFYLFIAIIIVFKLWHQILIIISIMLFYCTLHLFDTSLGPHSMIIPFTAGMLFYFIHIKYSSNWKLYSLLSVNYICSLGGAKPLAAQLGTFYNDPNAINQWVMLAIITFVYLIFLLIALKKINIKPHPIFQILGEIAYPFYLFHIYFLFFYWYFSSSVQADLLLFGILFIVILISWILNKFVEKPLSKFTSDTFKIIINFHNRKNTFTSIDNT